MSTRKNTYIYYIFIVALVSCGLFLFLEKSGLVETDIRFFSTYKIPNDKLCELLKEDANTRAKYFLDNGYEKREAIAYKGTEEVVLLEYSNDEWDSRIVFTTEGDRKDKIFWIYFSHEEKSLYIDVVKKISENSARVLPDSSKGGDAQRYKLSSSCYAKDAGFMKNEKEYVICITDYYF